jgi:hypothetical protein
MAQMVDDLLDGLDDAFVFVDDALLTKWKDPKKSIADFSQSERLQIVARKDDEDIMPGSKLFRQYSTNQPDLEELVTFFSEAEDEQHVYMKFIANNQKVTGIGAPKNLFKWNSGGKNNATVIRTDTIRSANVPNVVAVQFSIVPNQEWPKLVQISRSSRASKRKAEAEPVTEQGETKATFQSDVHVKRDLKVDGTITGKINAVGQDFAEWMPYQGRKPKFADLVKLKRQGNKSFVTLDTSGEGTLCVVSDEKQAGVICRKRPSTGHSSIASNDVLIAVIGQIKVNVDLSTANIGSFGENTSLTLRPSGNKDGKTILTDVMSAGTYGTVLSLVENEDQVLIYIAQLATHKLYEDKLPDGISVDIIPVGGDDPEAHQFDHRIFGRAVRFKHGMILFYNSFFFFTFFH